MPSLLVIRLHPVEAISGNDFTGYLNGLSIDAHEVSYIDPAGSGPAVGTATYIAPTLPASPTLDPLDPEPVPNQDPNTGIVQHFQINDLDIGTLGGPYERIFFAIATAVIQIPDPPPGGEFSTADVRLVITRGVNDFVHKQLYYNVPVAPAPIPADPNDFPGLQPISLHLVLPSPGQQLSATVLVPEDGTAPNFVSLRTAVENVLNAEPGNTAGIADLTRDQCRHIAYELIWDRMAYPIPAPRRSLEEMYTGPQAIDSDDERDRRIFEGDLLTYYTKHNSEADRLANFIFSLSAAIWCEQESRRATRVGFYFPVIPTSPGREAKVILKGAGAAMDPVFEVPAAYFYALTAILPPQVAREQRYRMVQLDAEAQIITNIEAAIEDQVLTEPVGVNRFQAARRLRALGLVGEAGTPECEVAPATEVHGLISHWLGRVEADINVFWGSLVPADVTGHLDLVLCAVTKTHPTSIPPFIPPLIAAIKDPAFGVNNVNDLSAKTSGEWEALLIPNPALLPEFTKPGTTEERTQAFIRHLRRFFDVSTSVGAPPPPTVDAPPGLRRAVQDPLHAFIDAYNALSAGPDFTFGVNWNEADFQNTLDDVFPADPPARAWLEQMLRTIHDLYVLANVGQPDEVRFSIAEALYARGFTSTQSVQETSLEDCQEALTGTVAYDHATAIHNNAGGQAPPGGSPGGGFQPINPDGTLTNCIPPPHLSPLGPVAYLHEMLQVSEDSTCENPFPFDVQSTLVDEIAARRGPLGDLHVTWTNLETPLPLIDIVNECLEAVTANLPASTAGVVYDTASDELGSHKLQPYGPETPGPDGTFRHDPVILFEALPEHSTPATPVAQPNAYDKLKSDFSSPLLPYAQPLDISRTYLRHLKTSRYAVMRRFRKDITEFVIDPGNEPLEFQRHLWRYPVRIEIAREYLGITPEEYELLFTHDIVDAPAVGSPLLHELYGFDVDMVGSQSWVEIVVRLDEFLRRTGLTYCEFFELWHAEFVRFRRVGEDPEFPNCEPCCLPEYEIQFEDPESPPEALKRLAVFIRLWRKLQSLDNAQYSFAEFRDICEVLELFHADGTINPD